jgi:RNA-dependent RNA polymerase
MKGVLSVNPNLPENGIHVRVRRSMIKFESDFNTLEILNVSKPASGFIERQKVLILSYLGIPDQAFIELQQETIHELLQSIQGIKFLFLLDLIRSNTRRNIDGRKRSSA